MVLLFCVDGTSPLSNLTASPSFVSVSVVALVVIGGGGDDVTNFLSAITMVGTCTALAQMKKGIIHSMLTVVIVATTLLL
jgi:hypothetical protein